MKKIILAVTFIVLTTEFSFAQERGVRYGAKFVYSMQDPTGKNSKDLDMKFFGFGFGGVANFPIIGQLSFNPELNLVSRVLYGYQMPKPIYDQMYQKELEYALIIPLMLQFAPVGGLYLGAGAQLDIPFDAKLSTEDDKNGTINDKDYDDRASLDFGIALEVGYHITESIGICLRAVIGLTEIAEDSKTSYNQYGLGVSYFF